MKNLSLKIKLVFITFFSLIILATVLASISVVNMEDALKNESYSKLTSARDSKIKQVNTFFNNRTSDIAILSRNNDVINLTKFLDKQIKEKDLEHLATAKKFEMKIVAYDTDFMPFEEYCTPKQFVGGLRKKPYDVER